MKPLATLLPALCLVSCLALWAGTPAWAQGPAPAPIVAPDTIAERARACTACHGQEGRATRSGYFPRIAGKPADYLLQQLVHFREGRRQNIAMHRLVQNLSDAYLRELAGYFAALDLPYPPPPPGAPAPARGAQLVRRGDARLRLPACTACHGSAMTGTLPAVPGLLGLPRDYLVAQLGSWRTGQRHAAAPDCMAEIAGRLGPADLEAVAQWLSAQPVPADAKAVPPDTAQRLPLDCGTVTP